MWSYDPEGQMVWGEKIPGYGDVHIADVRGWGYYLNKHGGDNVAAAKEMDEVGKLIAQAPQMAQEISALKEQLYDASQLLEKSHHVNDFNDVMTQLRRVLSRK